MLEYLFTRLSAAFNNRIELCRLGTFYYEGQYVTKDHQKATKYLQKAADKKYNRALFYLGLIELEKGEATTDRALALRYFLLSRREEPKAAAEIEKLEETILKLPPTKENSELLFKVGYMYANDVVIGTDAAKAAQFYEAAIAGNHQAARLELAKLLMKSRPGSPKDLPRAIALLQDPSMAQFLPAELALKELLEKNPDLSNES